MGRVLLTLDRLLALLVGAVLIALGLGAIAWQLGKLSWAQPRLTAGWLSTATNQAWWPWLTGGAGVLLILLGLWWLLSHLPRRRVGTVRLEGSGTAGILRANIDAVADAAAETLGRADGVQSASGKARVDRGRPTIMLDATVDPMVDLHELTATAKRVQGEIAQALDGAEVATRMHVHVSGG